MHKYNQWTVNYHLHANMVVVAAVIMGTIGTIGIRVGEEEGIMVVVIGGEVEADTVGIVMTGEPSYLAIFSSCNILWLDFVDLCR